MRDSRSGPVTQWPSGQGSQWHNISTTSPLITVPLRVSVIIPARNEVEALPQVLETIPPGLAHEVIVVDNGSSDGTAEVARAGGARVVAEPVAGYGRACLAGLAVLDPTSDTVVFLDADFSDDPRHLPELLAPIAKGQADLVIGSRVALALPGSLTLPQRLGNRLACWLMRRLFGARYTDLGPFRAIRRAALERLQMRDRAFGWTVEMQAKAARLGLRVAEVPVRYRPRIGRSKISGTLSGTIRAGNAILSTIARLAWAGAHSGQTERHGSSSARQLVLRPFDSGPGLGRGTLAQDVAHPEAKGRPASHRDARHRGERAKRVEGRRQWSPGLARGAPLRSGLALPRTEWARHEVSKAAGRVEGLVGSSDTADELTADERRRLVILLREPVAGRVKTRLAVEFGDAAACEVYRACVELTLERLGPLRDVTRLYVDPPEARASVSAWVGSAWRLASQRGETLGARLAQAMQEAFDSGASSVACIGTDSPWLSPDDIEAAWQALRTHEVVIGPSEDGGYYLIGLARPLTGLFEGVAWGDETVCETTLAKAHAMGLRVHLLPTGYDVDRLQDVERLRSDPRLASDERVGIYPGRVGGKKGRIPCLS